MGRGATATIERLAASLGALDEAAPRFDPALDVSKGGVLLALPAAFGLRTFASFRQILSTARGLLLSQDDLSASGLHGSCPAQIDLSAALLRARGMGKM